MRTLGGGISIGHEWMSPSQLASVGVGFDMEMNLAAAELPRFGPRGIDQGEGEGVPAAMQTSACLTTRPAWLRQIMCLPRAGGGVVLCIPHSLFDHQAHQTAQLRAKLCDVQTYSLAHAAAL